MREDARGNVELAKAFTNKHARWPPFFIVPNFFPKSEEISDKIKKNSIKAILYHSQIAFFHVYKKSAS